VSDGAPPGFEPFTRPSPLDLSAPGIDRLVLGLWLCEPHTNSRATAHGGLIAALADQAMGMSRGIKARAEGINVASLWTTSLTIDYLGSAKPDQWLEFAKTFARVGRTLWYAEMDISADGATAARGRASFCVALGEG
jgi:acyl-coenzyme A thioesterase PaaI-like protein